MANVALVVVKILEFLHDSRDVDDDGMVVMLNAVTVTELSVLHNIVATIKNLNKNIRNDGVNSIIIIIIDVCGCVCIYIDDKETK